MKVAFLLAGPLLVITAGAAAQTPPSPHQKHEATGQHQVSAQRHAAAGEQRCCCEEMMHKMMSEMMAKHQGTAKPSQKDQSQSDKPHSQ